MNHDKNHNKDVAIIGMACRFPGAADHPDAFWDLLIQEREAITTVPKARWVWPAEINPATTFPGIERGGFLPTIDEFDAAFFKISPREAKLMDPQQRYLLEMSWECFEDAGVTFSALDGSPTAVYIGMSNTDYNEVLRQNLAATGPYLNTGSGLFAAANRLSHFYNLTGPSIAIDTSASSSLVAICQAVLAIQNGQCTQALAGGIHLMCTPTTSISLYQAGMLSPDGVCRSFDKDANGYVRGEGGGLVLLKSLKHALADGDHIYGVIRGAATNHSGHTSSITVPSPEAQALLIQETYRQANFDLQTLGYIETHGSGTPVGDPLEIAGLKTAFENVALSQQDEISRANLHCGLGSVKSNIGHLEAASGVAGLIKVLLALRHSQIPATRHHHMLNPQIALSETPFHIVNQTESWSASSASETRRMAGVSSFGVGGVNAHLLVEEFPVSPCKPQTTIQEHLFVFSARSAKHLRLYIKKFMDFIALPTSRVLSLQSIAYTLQVGREEMDERLAVIAHSLDELKDHLSDYYHHNTHTLNYFSALVKAERSSNIINNKMEGAMLRLWCQERNLHLLAGKWITGAVIEWSLLYQGQTPERLSLPTYAFIREKFWVESAKQIVVPVSMEVQDDIAIIGMAGEFPGAPNLQTFWENLVQAKNVITAIPTQRPSRDAFFATDALVDERIQWGGFIQQMDHFDAAFFGVSPEEADSMDPEQRRLLQMVWHTLEDAGVPASSLSGSQTGVFIGATTSEYHLMQERAQVEKSMNASHYMLANRISYWLNLHGPSSVIDTASSSALVALHQAVQSLQQGECEQAFVGAVNLILTPQVSIALAKAGMLSPDGCCKAFDKSANGYVRAEAVTTLLLKPLARAIADNDRIHAVIKASVVQHSGKEELVSDSNINAQADLIKAAFHKGNIDPQSVSYIELHGAGTSMGDPVEFNGLKKAIAELNAEWGYASSGYPQCALGAVKTHMGHAESAAGLVSVMKVVLAMQHKTLPKNLFLKEINPLIDLNATPFYLMNHLEPWSAKANAQQCNTPRRAGVNTLGFGGVNAHVILEEYKKPVLPPCPDMTNLIVLSAKTAESLMQQVRLFVGHLQANTALSFNDVAYTLQLGRDHLEHRLAIIASSITELQTVLAALLIGETNLPQVFQSEIDIKTLESEAQDEIEPYIVEKDFTNLAYEWLSGVRIDWQRLYTLLKPQRIALPLYPFAAESHWFQSIEISNQHKATYASLDVLEKWHSRLVDMEVKRPKGCDKIAIVGMSGRFPDAPNLDVFWQNLAKGMVSTKAIPPTRWRMKGEKHWLAALEDVDLFDATFFGMSDDDAAALDPQQRLLMQEAWKAFQDANYTQAQLEGLLCGTFVCTAPNDYDAILKRTNARFSPSASAVKLAQSLNLKGPALSLDSEGSSAIVALHLAALALKNKEFDIALVGGANLHLNAERYQSLVDAGLLSSDGLCRSFDKEAEGFGLGEGVAAVVLKRLEDAIRDKDVIHGVLIASGINHNGNTTPNVNAAAKLLTRIYAENQINPDTITYIEAEGMSIKRHDAAELAALNSVYSVASTQPCAIGSVKTQIGHTGPVSGLAGLLKILLCLRHQEWLPSLNFTSANEQIDFSHGTFFLNQKTQAWAAPLRRAALNAFGLNGTNAHCVLEEYQEPVRSLPAERPVLILLSADSALQLQQLALQLLNHLSWYPKARPLVLADLAYTLQTCRHAKAFRVAITCEDLTDLLTKLEAYCSGAVTLSGIDQAEVETQAEYLRILNEDEDLRLGVEQWLRKGKLKQIASAWVQGVEMQWLLLYTNESVRKVALPADVFAEKRHWIEPISTSVVATSLDSHHLHSLLHHNVSQFGLQQFLSVFRRDHVVLSDYELMQKTVLPAAVFLEMARAALSFSTRESLVSIENVFFISPAVLTQEALQLTTDLYKQENKVRFEINEGKKLKAYGQLITGKSIENPKPPVNIEALLSCGVETLTGDAFYELLAPLGLYYGDGMRCIKSLVLNPQELVATLDYVPQAFGLVLPPNIIDAVMQASVCIASLHVGRIHIPKLLVPFSLKKCVYYKPLHTRIYAHARICQGSDFFQTFKKFDIDWYDANGELCLSMQEFMLAPWELYQANNNKKLATVSAEEEDRDMPPWVSGRMVRAAPFLPLST